MKPGNLHFHGGGNETADLTFRPDQDWGGFTALTENGRELGSMIALRGLASTDVGTDAAKFMEPVLADRDLGVYKKSHLAGKATLYLVISDPNSHSGLRDQAVVNDVVTELAPLHVVLGKSPKKS